MGGNKNGTATVWIITCIQRYTHFHGQKDTHKRTNTHNRKSVSEWEEAGRLAGAVLVEDMASVHLSISKHSVIFPLTGEVVISLFFSPLHHTPFLISAFPLCSSLLSWLIYLLPTSLFTSFPHSLYLFFSIFLLFLFHSTLLLSIPSFLCSLSSAALSVEQSIQQQNKAAYSITHRLIKQNRMQQPWDPLNSTMIPAGKETNSGGGRRWGKPEGGCTGTITLMSCVTFLQLIRAESKFHPRGFGSVCLCFI